ncbi:MAG: transporter ATP-binding protein [Actinomycetia bacterium]|nr:transporter ATP-binding protein [Actinomycetes bacterium]
MSRRPVPAGAMRANHIWKRFRPDRKAKRLRTAMHYRKATQQGLRTKGRQWTWALRDIDFSVDPGESIALIGANGSGKSTMLKILSQVMYPHSGLMEVEGRVGALIEVAAGIHPQLSGRENVYIYGSLLGLSRKDVTRRFDDIIAFAGVEHAVDRLVKFYSSGMKMRIGFAIAAFLEPDILLVDEVLSVGDASFQRRCLERMSEVLAEGATLVYVSHDLATVEATCARAVWLDYGVMRADGPVRAVLTDYRQAIEERDKLELRADGDARIGEVVVCGPDGGPARTDEAFHVRLHVDAMAPMDATVFLGVSEGPSTPIFSVRHEVRLGDRRAIRCTIPSLPLPGGKYYVWAGIRGPRKDLLHWSPVANFEVVGPDLDPAPNGVVRMAPLYTRAAWDLE